MELKSLIPRLMNSTGANVSQTNSSLNRTTWPTQGGSLVVKDEHDWALTYVNIGLGNNVTSFNVSLIAALNQTSNGTLCIPSLAGEAMRSLGATNGANASIQVVTINAEGNALYNVCTPSNLSPITRD